MSSADDKWSARRGSQGDNWRWEGSTPPDPGQTPPSERIFSKEPEKPVRRFPAVPVKAALAGVASFAVAAAALTARPVRQLWRRATERQARGEAHDFTRFAAVLTVFTLIAAIALVVVLIASALDDDDTGGPSVPTDEPTATAEETPDATESPAPTPGGETPAPTATATPDVLTPPVPEGDVSLGLWANELDAWWFGSLAAGSAVYHPGDEIPWLLRWDAEPGTEYMIEITYECRADDIALIDLLTGVEQAHDAIFLAEWGPGTTLPEAAVPVPDTPDSEIDDAAPGLLYLYGGTFSLLPAGPAPEGFCDDERTISVPVRATAETVILMGSAWLAHPEDHNGLGAADAAGPIRLQAEVAGIGEAAVTIPADVVGS